MTTATKTATAESIRAHIESLIRAFNEHDAKKVISHFTDDVEWMAPLLDAPVVGRDAAEHEVERTIEAMPDLQMPLDDVEVFYADDGRRAIASFRFTGTMTGRMDPPGFAPTGRHAEFFGVCRYEFRDGLIAKHTIVYDGLRFAQDLGLLPGNESIAVKALVGTQRLVGGVTKLIHR